MIYRYILSILSTLFGAVNGSGLMLLYRPRDISNDCAFSKQLRYDLSFGMGMSDTITLIFRTMSEVDYECGVEIVTESRSDVYLLIVIRFPNSIVVNCQLNPDAFTVLKKQLCIRLCDQMGDRDIYSPYFAVSVKGRIRFRFLSNSSLNSDMDANLYEVTATSARVKGKAPCFRINETICVMGDDEFCFTSGVVCDGIKNCGVSDWFDERKSDCKLPGQRLGYTPVIAVAAAIICALLAAIHIVLQCLPPLANSFFIFNANEDNRFCIDSVFKSPENIIRETQKGRKDSLIPVFSSTSSSSDDTEYKAPSENMAHELSDLTHGTSFVTTEEQKPRRHTTVRSMTARLHETFRSVTGRGIKSVSDPTSSTSPPVQRRRTFDA